MFYFCIISDFFDVLELAVVAVQTDEEDARFFDVTSQYSFGSNHAKIMTLMI